MFASIEPEMANGATRELLDATQRQLGRIPNLYRAMANSPIALAGYLAFRDVLQKGELAVDMRERVALLTAQLNACDYCVSAHAFRSQKIGLSAEDIWNTRRAVSDNRAIDAALKFVVELIEYRGRASNSTLLKLANLGWTEAAIGELVGHVALNTLSNYFKHVAQPELDFPAAPPLTQEWGDTLEYIVEASSVEGHWVATSKFGFDETLVTLKRAITECELLLISEIDPQRILMSAGMKLRPARQLLFFHPRYMKRMLQSDARAVPEVPLKIAVLEAADHTVVLRGADPIRSFAPYPALVDLATEMEALRAQIVAAVSA